LILDTQLVIARDNGRGDDEKRPECSAGEMKPRCQAAPHPQAACPGGPAQQAAPFILAVSILRCELDSLGEIQKSILHTLTKCEVSKCPRVIQK
jgi:hypothetical protein